ncbi:hypothetical protein LCGC14_0906820 [marine sediment metagenome]|uniref:Uncharacterized protein n=1 Tax=marine sediment metagenome TaxID=412755 RepID=A0A0F9PFH0_9ZZZZ
MRRRPRTPPLPFHTSEQRYSPEMHQQVAEDLYAKTPQLEADLAREVRRRNATPHAGNPRYLLTHDPGEFPSNLPNFTLTFHAPSPSAAKHFGHHIANKLDVSLCFFDRATNEVLELGPLSADDD